MLRRAKKRDQPLADAAYEGGPAATGAPSSSSSPMPSSPNQPQQPFYQSRHGSSRHLLNPSQSHIAAAVAADDTSRYPAISPKPNHPRLPSSSSVEAMPPPQAPSAASASQPMGRSQSTLNLFFSKAKNSITGSNQQQQQHHTNMNASHSSGSLGSLQEDVAGGASYASSRPSISLQHPGASYAIPSTSAGGRSSSSNDYRQVVTKPSVELDHAPLGLSATSPTKKGFFSRERKTSMATARSPGQSRMTTQQQQQQQQGGASSIYSRGPGSSHYGQFSKSQSDLHHMSPRAQYAELPRMPQLPQSIPDERSASGASNTLLTSPSMLGSNGVMSRSVEDLNYPALSSSSSGGGTSAGPRSPSPQPGGGPMYSSSPRAAGTWGEHGMPGGQQQWGRPSDIGTIGPGSGGGGSEMSKSRQTSASGSGIARAISPSGSRPDQIPFSSASSQWPPQRGTSPTPDYSQQQQQQASSAYAGHQRKTSKLPMVGSDGGFFGGGQGGGGGRERKATGSSLASSFSLTNVAAGASSVMDKLRGGSSSGSIASVQQQQQQQGYYRERASSSADSLKDLASASSAAAASVPLPPGCTHQGLLNRNGNLSLSLAQLGGPGTREREKDVTKGWKPYKVLLRDHSLVFYKPSSNLAEDVKAWFPSGIVRASPAGEGAGSSSGLSQAYASQKLDADMLKQSGLGTRDLLNATSSGATGAPAAPSKGGAMASPSKKLPGAPLAAAAAAATMSPASSPASTSWHMPGAHADLVLVTSRERPEHWAQRIHSGTLEALVHEVVYATQLLAQDEPQDTATMAQTTILSALASGHSLVDFISHLSSQVTSALQGQGEAEGQAATETPRSAVRGRAGWCFDVLLAKYADAIDAQAQSMLEQLVSNTEGLDIDVAAAIKEQSSAPSVPRPVPMDWSKQVADPPRPRLASLASGVFSASDLLSFEPADVASQIQIFHADRLRALAIPEPTMSALATTSEGGSSATLFSFSGARPHYLTTLILEQVLDCRALEASEGSSNTSAATLAQHARHRASLLRHWIAIASYSLTYGDVLAWTAIMAALCSRAISRLEHTWRLVAEGDRTLLASSWAPKLSKLQWNEDGSLPVEAAVSMSSVTTRTPKSKDGRKPHCVPFLGDALVEIVSAASASGGQEQQQQHHIAIASLTQSSDRLYDAVAKWAGQTFKGTRLQPDAIIFVARPIVEFQQLLQILSSQSQTQSPPSKPISSYLEPSLRLEPRTLGNIDRSWRPPLPAALNAKTLVPLVFPEALPNLDLFDRRQIVSCAASDDHRMGSANLSRDYDATIRGPSGGGGAGGGGGASRYVRSPLSGTPLMRASIQSLSRSKVAGMGSPGARAAAMPFGLITEWAGNRSLSSNGTGSPAEDETLHRIGNDLILKSLDDAPVSLPSTPMTSKRFSQDFGSRATRPLSQVSRRSSLPASQRSSVIETVLPTQVAVKAGTLERLVDVLVLGVTDLSISLNSGSNDESANGGGGGAGDPTRISRLSLDLPTYRSAFLATFRSTCSPIVLFDFLRKRFLAAVNAGREIPNLPQGPNASRFPSWSLIDASAGQALEPVEWDFVGRVRQGVIAVLKQWVRSYTQDFVDEPELYDAVIAFAKGQASGVKVAKPDDTDLPRAVAGLEEVAALLRSSAFKTNARHARDVAAAKSTRPSSSSASATAAASRDLDFDFDQATPVALVDYLESVAGVFFDKITERDLLIAAELLERQAQDPLGWHIVRDAGPDEPQVLTMYKLLELLKPASPPAFGNSSSKGGAHSSSSSSSPSLGERMPAAVRDACAAQSLLRGWIAIHIIESRIGVHHRQKRIEKLIDAIWLCRARMVRARNGPEDVAASNGLASPSLPAATPFQDATVGSFVESIILASLTASESRTFVRAWQGVCHARSGTGEGLEDLLPRQDALAALNQAAAVSSFPSATPDVGWLLRSIAQAVSRRSAVAQADSTYVDFGRSQIVHNLIESSLAIRRQPASGSDGTTKTNAPAIDPKAAELAGARLSMMQTKLRKIVWDRRAFKEDAAHEANSVPPLPRDTTWRAYRPLQKLMAEQQDKQQRDRHAFETLRAALDAAKTSATGARSPGMGPQEIVGRASTSSAVTLMVPPGGGGGGALPADKKSRRMTSLWRGAARLGGGSVAGSSGGAGSVTGGELVGQRPYADLVAAIPISQKPSNIVALGGAEVNVWNNSQRSFLFHVNSLDGQRMLLQASGQAELADWLTHIDKAVREGPRPPGSSSDARRRGFGAAGGGKASSTSTSANFTSLFGNDITTLVEKEGRAIPLGLERMFTEIESRGLQEVGIYRISGSKSTIEAMEQAFRTKPPDSIDLQHGDFSDVHAISGLIKLWFRELPEPVVPYAFYHAIVEAEQLENSDDRLIALRDLIWSFPKAHFDLLRRTCEHLARVVEEGEKNKMLPHNIGLIFGTSLLNPPPSATSVAEAFGQIGRKANFVKIIVQYYEWVFAEAEEEAEGEGDPEAEVDADGQEDLEQEDKADAASAPSLGLENIDEVSTASTTAAPAPPSSNDHEGVTADELLLQLQSDASAAAAAAAATNAGGFSSVDRDGSVDSQRRAQQQQQPTTSSSTNVSTADASSMGQALKRPDLPRRDSRREELSIYQDAVDIDLGESAAVAVRSSLLPDEAMMDMLRAMRHDEEMQREQAAAAAAQQGQQQQRQR